MNQQQFLDSILEKSMLITEKRKYYNGTVTKENLRYLEDWKNQKNLVTDEILKMILEKEGMSENEFAYSISPFKTLETYDIPEWMNILKQILNEFNIEDIQALPFWDISIAIYPFINYISNVINNFKWGSSGIILSQHALEDIIKAYIIHSLNFFEKCLVVELNEYKKNHKFNTNNKNEQFEEFLKNMFSTKEQYYEFYEKYAVSTRLVTECSLYFVSNIYEFFRNLINSLDEIDNNLHIRIHEIKSLEFSVGDTHEKGKEVIIVKSENGTVVYKPKNLDICKAFSDFIQYLNSTLNGLDLKTPNGVYKDTFAFLEFIEYKNCYSENEIERFYERFGYILALGYFFSITDLHLENIIAAGEYPIIVDGETMMQNSIKYYKTENVLTHFYSQYYMDTVLSTALLPNTAKLDNSLDLSGLAGDEQTSQKKYLSAVSIGTSDFHFEEKEYTMDAASNIPMIKDKKVNFKKYNYHIINGFTKVCEYFYNHKEFFVSDINSPLHEFENKKIRFLVKSTQKYGDMLTYLNHPSCCSRMSIRERVLQNIWAYPHSNKNIIKSEYQDMLFNDIPIFYSLTDSTDLYDSYGNLYENYFTETGYHKVLNRIKAIDSKQIKLQKDLLCLHLGIYDEYKRSEFSRKRYTFTDCKINTLAEAEKIGKQIISEADEDSFNNILWKYIKIDEISTSLGIAGLDLYDGISGIATFFFELYRISGKKIFYEYYNKCVCNCEKELKYMPDEFSAYCSKFSLLFPIMLELKWFQHSNHLEIFHVLLKKFKEMDKITIKKSKKFSIEWINGISSLLVIVAEILEHINCLSREEYNFLTKFICNLKEIILEELSTYSPVVGQAHGYSGIMLALARFTKFVNLKEREELYNIIKCYLKKELELYEIEYKNNRDKWCNGLCGMIIARLEIKKICPDIGINRELDVLISKLIECQKDMFMGDSLCHGNAGTIFVIKNLLENHIDFDNELKAILNKMLIQMWGESLYNGYHLVGTMCVNNMGLFTGYAGIGLMYLKMYDPTVCNVFTLL